MSDSAKKHWYSFVFVYSVVGVTTQSSTYIGYAEKDKITMDRVKDARFHAGCPNDALMLSVSYLGAMTKEEFFDEKQT